jgi:hypothetical protein
VELYREFNEVPEELRLDADGCARLLMWTRAAWAPRPPRTAAPRETPPRLGST